MAARRRRDEQGATALELAFLAPGLLFLIFIGIQAALFFYGRNVAIQSAREGVSQLRLAQDQATYEQVIPQVRTQTEEFADQVGRGGLNNAAVTFPTAPDYGSRFPRATVTVTGTTITLIPGLALHTSATASGSVERFESDQ